MTATDDELLARTAGLYADLDPAPEDLADGVLARLAVEDLETEWELLTLVERVDTRVGTRAEAEPETSEHRRPRVRRHDVPRPGARQHADDGTRRLDGWVVPALPMRVFLGPPGDALAHTRQSAYADATAASSSRPRCTGEVRLWLLPQSGRDEQAVPPFVTPAFLV